MRRRCRCSICKHPSITAAPSEYRTAESGVAPPYGKSLVLDHYVAQTDPLASPATQDLRDAAADLRDVELPCAGAVPGGGTASGAASTGRTPQRSGNFTVYVNTDLGAFATMAAAVDHGLDPVVRCHDRLLPPRGLRQGTCRRSLFGLRALRIIEHLARCRCSLRARLASVLCRHIGVSSLTGSWQRAMHGRNWRCTTGASSS